MTIIDGGDKIAKIIYPMHKSFKKVAAHLIYGSSDVRFKITYCTELLTEDEVRGVGFEYMPYKDAEWIYPHEHLTDGWNTVNGEEIFYISNPALGLWKKD